MRILITSILIVLLSGCGVTQSWFGTEYDSGEYTAFVRMQVSARLAVENCDDPVAIWNDITLLRQQVEYLYVYAKHRSDDDIYEIAKILRANVNELRDAYLANNKPKAYCTFKLKILSQHISRALEAVTSKE